MVPINTDSILSTCMVLCGVRSAARACPVMRHKLVIHTCNVKLQVSMSLMCCINLYHFFTIFTWWVWGFKGCQWVQKTLLVSTTANTVTSLTQTHLKLQENHPKFLLARQQPLLPSKSVRSQFFFFSLPPDPPLQPLVLDPRSATPLVGTKSYHIETHLFQVCPSLYQSTSPFDTHWAFSADHFDNFALGSCDSFALPFPFTAVMGDSKSWNHSINFGFARSKNASMARLSRLTPQMKVIGELLSSSPSSNTAPYISSAVLELVGADLNISSFTSPDPFMSGAGFRRSCKVGGGSVLSYNRWGIKIIIFLLLKA